MASPRGSVFPIETTVGTSDANTAQTVSSPGRGRRVLKMVTVAYSANVSLDVTVTLNAGAGAAYDTRLGTMTLGVNRWGVYVPDIPIPFAPSDAIDVVAPAGGSGVTSGVQIYAEPE